MYKKVHKLMLNTTQILKYIFTCLLMNLLMFSIIFIIFIFILINKQFIFLKYSQIIIIITMYLDN